MRNIWCLIVLLTIFSCNKDNSNEVDLSKDDHVSINDLVDSISVVKLETNSECLINLMTQVISYKNRFYIYDRRLYSILCFDSNGKYLFKINKKGRGPEEYSNCEFINIDKYNNQIMILVPWGYILYFDIEGNFISKVKLPEEISAYNEVYALNKDILLFISNNEYRASYYSRSRNTIIKRLLKVETEQLGVFSPTRKSYEYNDSVFFKDDYSNKIINLSDTNNPIHYTLNFGDNNNTENQLKAFNEYITNQRRARKGEELEKIMYDKRYFNHYPSGCIETKNFIVVSLYFEGTTKFVVYNKKKNINYVFKETVEGVKPYITCSYKAPIIIGSSNKNKQYLNKILTVKQWQTIQSHNPDNDNPFLVIYHLK